MAKTSEPQKTFRSEYKLPYEMSDKAIISDERIFKDLAKHIIERMDLDTLKSMFRTNKVDPRDKSFMGSLEFAYDNGKSVQDYDRAKRLRLEHNILYEISLTV